jgi:hypothetical protein
MKTNSHDKQWHKLKLCPNNRARLNIMDDVIKKISVLSCKKVIKLNETADEFRLTAAYDIEDSYVVIKKWINDVIFICNSIVNKYQNQRKIEYRINVEVDNDGVVLCPWFRIISENADLANENANEIPGVPAICFVKKISLFSIYRLRYEKKLMITIPTQTRISDLCLLVNNIIIPDETYDLSGYEYYETDGIAGKTYYKKG